MTEKKEKKSIENSLTDLTSQVVNNPNNIPTINKTDSAMLNVRHDLVFNNRALLNSLYIEHGIIQTLVDQPVDDAFRHGVSIISEKLGDDADVLNRFMEEERIWDSIQQTMKWSRLFGGGGIVILTDQPNQDEFKIERIRENSRLEFYPADCWELSLNFLSDNVDAHFEHSDSPYNFYGHFLHKSRVLKVKGKEAPSLYRRRFRGWGMTEVERLLRSFNQYLKNNNVIFELMDEAKVDVFKIKDLNSALLTNTGTNNTAKRIELANQLKNFLNALVMDINDEYEQKTMTFQGLGQLLQQIRIGIASDLRMPVTKLFGVSSAGFNSGEDDIENYNAMIESEIRAKVHYIIIPVLKICCQKLFGFVPEDIDIEFHPLRILSAEQEENVKDRKYNRVMNALSNGLIDPKEAKIMINEANLLPVQVDETDEIFENPGITEPEKADEAVATNQN